MPKLRCTCGFLFNLSRTTAAEHALVPESILEDAVASTDAAAELIDRIDAASRHVLLCPKCARLWLQCEGQSVNYWQYERVEDVT